MYTQFRRCSLVLLGIALVGCNDAGVVGPGTKPTPNRPASLTYAPGEYDGSVPWYASENDIILPEVYERMPFVYWSGETATAASSMKYWGNRAEETFEMKITGVAPGSGGRQAESTSYGGFFPVYYTHITPGFSSSAASSCGNQVDLASQHTAKFVFFIEIKGFGSLKTTVPDGYRAEQEACQTEDKQEQQAGGGNEDCPECVETPQWCTIRYYYDKGTGEILYYYILWCS